MKRDKIKREIEKNVWVRKLFSFEKEKEMPEKANLSRLENVRFFVGFKITCLLKIVREVCR